MLEKHLHAEPQKPVGFSSFCFEILVRQHFESDVPYLHGLQNNIDADLVSFEVFGFRREAS